MVYVSDEGFEFVFEPIEDTIKVKKIETGFEVRYLAYGEYSNSPDEDAGENLFLVAYHRNFTVDRGKRIDGRWTPGISQELAQCIERGGKYKNGSDCDEAKDYRRKYHVFRLEAYIHSGVSLALADEGDFPDRNWDVSYLGLVFASKKEWRLRKNAKKAAERLIEDRNLYLTGEDYNIVKETYNENKKRLSYDCVCGYQGKEWALEALETDI